MQISSVAQIALSLQSTNAASDVSVAVAGKALGIEKQVGEMAVQMIQSAVLAMSGNVGTKLDTSA